MKTMVLKQNDKTIVLSEEEQAKVYEHYRLQKIMNEILEEMSKRKMKLKFNSQTNLEIVAKNVIQNMEIYNYSSTKSICLALDDENFLKQHTHYHNESKTMSVQDYNEHFLPMIDRAYGFISSIDSMVNHMDDAKVNKNEVHRMLELYNYCGETVNTIQTALNFYKEYEGLHKLEGYTDVKLDTANNLMICGHCNTPIGTASDWTPNYCRECGGMLTGGNGKCSE